MDVNNQDSITVCFDFKLHSDLVTYLMPKRYRWALPVTFNNYVLIRWPVLMNADILEGGDGRYIWGNTGLAV